MPVVVYALDLCMCALSYVLLQAQIIKLEGPASLLRSAVGRDRKGKVSLACYVLAIPLALAGWPVLAGLLIGLVACIWFIPDRRIEAQLAEH